MRVAGKTLLVVAGGGVWQLPVIRRARELGLKVVVTDRNSAAEGLQLADYGEVADAGDRDAVLRIAQRHVVDGVVSEQTDVGVATAAYVAERLSLPGIGYETALAATNKWLMRECCRVAGIPVPRYRRVETVDDAVAAAEEIGYPVVMKPVDAQSSRGVAKLADKTSLMHWFSTAKDSSVSGAVLVEELMVGIESSAEAFVHPGGDAELFGICDKVKSPPPYSFDLRLVYPAAFSPTVVKEIKVMNERVIRALGISMGITHAEYIVTPTGVRLIEIAARGCGAGVATALIPAMTGADLIEARIRQALGAEAHPERRWNKAGVLEFLSLLPGRIRTISGLEKARSIAGVLSVSCNLRTGDIVYLARNGAERHGSFLGVASDRTYVLALAERVKSTIQVEVEQMAPGETARTVGAVC